MIPDTNFLNVLDRRVASKEIVDSETILDIERAWDAVEHDDPMMVFNMRDCLARKLGEHMLH